MKKNITICLMLTLMSALLSIETNAQSTSGNNNYVPGKFLGFTQTANNLNFGFGSGPTIYMTLSPLGDLDLRTSSKSYMIANNPVLRHKGFTSNIYVGVGSGAGATTTGIFNTCVGSNSGFSNTSGHSNTFSPLVFSVGCATRHQQPSLAFNANI